MLALQPLGAIEPGTGTQRQARMVVPTVHRALRAGTMEGANNEVRTAKLPETVFRLGLSSGALALYSVLLLFRNSSSGTAWPKRRTMCELAGIYYNTAT